MVIKNLENKIKLVLIICSLFLTGCIIISISSIWTARTMVNDAHQKVYVLDGNRNAGCGSQESCGNVPPVLLHACP